MVKYHNYNIINNTMNKKLLLGIVIGILVLIPTVGLIYYFVIGAPKQVVIPNQILSTTGAKCGSFHFELGTMEFYDKFEFYTTCSSSTGAIDSPIPSRITSTGLGSIWEGNCYNNKYGWEETKISVELSDKINEICEYPILTDEEVKNRLNEQYGTTCSIQFCIETDTSEQVGAQLGTRDQIRKFCNNGIKDEKEEGIDCGGICSKVKECVCIDNQVKKCDKDEKIVTEICVNNQWKVIKEAKESCGGDSIEDKCTVTEDCDIGYKCENNVCIMKDIIVCETDEHCDSRKICKDNICIEKPPINWKTIGIIAGSVIIGTTIFILIIFMIIRKPKKRRK